MFIRHEDAERFVARVRGDEPEFATKLRIEERELEAGELKCERSELSPQRRPAFRRAFPHRHAMRVALR